MSSGIEDDVEPVRDPQHAHGDGGIPRSAEGGVLQKQQQDDDVAPEHDARVRNPGGHHVRVRAHDPQDVGRERHAGDAEHERQRQSQKDGLRGCAAGAEVGWSVLARVLIVARS